MTFGCTGCGACCKRAGMIADLLTGDLSFPYRTDASGKCEKLTADNRCAVYNDRPLVCRVDAMADRSGKPRETYFADTAKACNAMMDADGVPASFRITV